MKNFDRARAYVAKIPPSIQGSQGDKRLFSTAVILTNDFALNDNEAMIILEEYNERSLPKWSTKELTKKLENAKKYGAGVGGSKKSFVASDEKARTQEVKDNNSSTSVEVDFPHEPEILSRTVESPQNFPFDSLGEILAPVARKIYDHVQAPDAVVGSSVLAAANLAVQPFVNISLGDGRDVLLTLFFLTIADSGERKTAVREIVFREFYNYKEQQNEEYVEKKIDYDVEGASYKNQKQGLEASTKLTIKNTKKVLSEEEITTIIEENKAKLKEIEKSKPAPLMSPSMFHENVTTEALYKALLHRPCVALVSDEAGIVFGGFSFNKDNIVKTTACFSSVWSSGKLDHGTIGKGQTDFSGRRCGLFLMGQPQVITPFLLKEMERNQGFVNRMLIAHPSSKAGTRTQKNSKWQDYEEIKQYNTHLRKILDIGLITKGTGAKFFDLDVQEIELSPEAEEVRSKFSQWKEDLLKRKNSPAVKACLSRIEELSIRIAGTLQMFQELPSVFEERSNKAITDIKINRDNMVRAIQLAKYYFSEYERVARSANLPEAIADAESLVCWLQQQASSYQWLTNIVQKGPNSLRNTTYVKELLPILEDHSWVKKVPWNPKMKGEIGKKRRLGVWKVRKDIKYESFRKETS